MQDSVNVTLSVVMPVYNHPEELKVMIDSVRENSFADWELILVDDGSDEETKSVLNRYVEEDSRMVLIERDRLPKGAPTCRNIGMDVARGKYIIILDSDDYIAPYCFEQRVREMEKHPEYDFMVFRNGVFEDGKFHSYYPKLSFGYGIYDDDLKAFCQRTLPFVVWNNIYRKKSLEEQNVRWDEQLLSLQDSQFNVDALLAGMRYGYSDCPADIGWRIGTVGSISKKIDTEAHRKSNEYASSSLKNKIEERYGRKYSFALRRGRMFIKNLSAKREETDTKRVKHMLRRLKRQISMLDYLLWYRYMENKWIPKRIERILSIDKQRKYN